MGEQAGIEAPVGDAQVPTTTETAPVDTQSATQDNSGQNEGGDNPAWAKFLEVIPTQLHSQVKPVLKEWDQGVNQRFQEIHQRYEPFKQYIDEGVTPEQIAQARQLYQLLDTDPRALYDQMGQYYGYVGTGGQESPVNPQAVEPGAESQSEFDFGTPELNQAWSGMQAQLSQQEQILQTVAQLLVSQQEQELSVASEKALDEQLSAAREKYGQFDEPTVLSLIAQGMEPEKAVEHFQSLITNALTERQRPPSPQVLSGAGGSMPTNQLDVTKLTPAQTRALVAEMAAKAAGQAQT